MAGQLGLDQAKPRADNKDYVKLRGGEYGYPTYPQVVPVYPPWWWRRRSTPTT